jgi:hypothetical protein
MACSRDFPPATLINNPGSVELSGALVRFVTDGLVATLEFYRAGQLSPHRFAWELAARTDTLAELCPASRAVTTPEWNSSAAASRSDCKAGRIRWCQP